MEVEGVELGQLDVYKKPKTSPVAQTQLLLYLDDQELEVRFTLPL